MAQRISVGIDIGSYQIKVVVAEKDRANGEKRILATGFAESKGLRHGYIINVADTARCIELAVAEAEKQAGIKIKRAYISAGGIGLSSIVSKGTAIVSRADSEITNLDIDSAAAAAQSEIPPALLMNKMIIHPIPLAYKIDDQPVIGRPKGMYGTKLEVKMLFVVCLKQHLDDLFRAVERAGIEVIDAMASPLAAGVAALTKAQKMAGCVLVNIGSETISMVVYENDIPISLEVFQTGSTSITNDIALGLRVPIDEAEQIKIGTASGEAHYPKKKLDDIIKSRLADMFSLVEAHLKKIGRSNLLPAGIILTGGGTGVESIEDIARSTLELPSKIAPVHVLANLASGTLHDPSWSVAYGLAIWGLDVESEGVLHLSVPKAPVLKNAGNFFKRFLP